MKGHYGSDVLENGSTATNMWVTPNPNPPYAPIYSATQTSGLSTRVYVIDTLTVNHGFLPPQSPYRDISGVSYLTTDPAVSTTSAVFTTVYGVDPAPASVTSIAMTGYSMTSPQMTLAGETVLGPGTATYQSNFNELVAISNLTNVLGPGFDLSPYQGDPTLGVYVFKTTIPLSAIQPVPEPATVGLVTAGATSLLLGRRNRGSIKLCV